MGNEEEKKKTDILNIKKKLNSGFKNPKMSFSSILREDDESLLILSNSELSCKYHFPFLEMPIKTILFDFSTPRAIAAAEINETSCSPERPP